MLSDDLLSGAAAAAAAEYSGLKTRTIYWLCERDILPVIKAGRTLYFRRSELDLFFSSSRSPIN